MKTPHTAANRGIMEALGVYAMAGLVMPQVAITWLAEAVFTTAKADHTDQEVVRAIQQWLAQDDFSVPTFTSGVESAPVYHFAKALEAAAKEVEAILARRPVPDGLEDQVQASVQMALDRENPLVKYQLTKRFNCLVFELVPEDLTIGDLCGQ